MQEDPVIRVAKDLVPIALVGCTNAAAPAFSTENRKKEYLICHFAKDLYSRWLESISRAKFALEPVAGCSPLLR
jgi:hypothetical protein